MSIAVNKRVRQRDVAITGVTRGNNLGFKFSLTTPAALATAKLTIKANIGDADPGIVAKVVTATPTSNGQIIDSGAGGKAIVLFLLSQSDTSAFTATTSYVWDLEVFDGSSNASTPRGGTIVFNERARTATG